MLDSDDDHFVGKIAPKALIVNGYSVLLVRHVGSTTTFELLGGRLNKNEDPRSGVVREIYEELRTSFVVGEVVSVEPFVMKRTGEQHLAIVFKAQLENADILFELAADEVAEMAWVDKDNWQIYSLFGNYAWVVGEYFKAEVQ